MKTLIVLLAIATTAFSQTREELMQFLPMGKQMAFETYIASSGRLVSRFSQPEHVYEKGPAKGLTKATAPTRFHVIWEKLDIKAKEKYARRAYESGRGADVAAYLRKQQEGEKATEETDFSVVGDTVYKNNVPYGKLSNGRVIPFVQD